MTPWQTSLYLLKVKIQLTNYAMGETYTLNYLQ